VPTTTSCNGYACDSGTNLCKVACTGDTDCLSGFYCDNTGHCMGQKTSMAPCALADCYMSKACNECLTDQACPIPPGKCP
jgi:hypothetical protein